MMLAVDGSRLTFLSVNRNWEPGTTLGEIAQADVVRAIAPTVGAGWRTVRIELRDRDPIILKAVGSSADDLAELLSA